MEIKFNQKALRDLEKQATQRVAVPLDGSETDAARKVKQEYKRNSGVELDDKAALKLVREARKNAGK